MVLLMWLAAAQEEGPLPNEYCPVMQGERAVGEYMLVHEGRPVYFCCNNCLFAFRHEPDTYVGNLPQFRARDGGFAALWRRVAISRLMDDLVRMRPTLLIVLAGLAAYLIGRRVPSVRRAAADDPAPAGRGLRIARAILNGPRLASILLALMLAHVAWLYVPLAASQVPEGDRQSDSDVLLQFEREITRQALLQGDGVHVRGLEATYYRGNNERDAALGLGGIYRTCVFRISICTREGDRIRPGSTLGAEPIQLRVEIERSPFTAPDFYTDETMAKAKLMGAPEAGEATPPIIGFTTVQPEWRWEAYYPLGTPVGEPYHNMDGIVFLAHTSTDRPDLVWRSAHYAIPWRILLRDGVVQSTSRLWMAATLVAGDFDDSNFDEWLSLNPIPELTEPNTEDRALLGLPREGQPVEETP